MRKKNLQIIIFLVALSIGNKVIGGRPAPEEWKDSVGHSAPTLVVQTADKLWDAMEAADIARAQWNLSHHPSPKEFLQDMGHYMFQRLRPFNTPGMILSLLFAPFTRILENTPYEYEHPTKTAFVLMQERWSELESALFNFKKTVKEHVRGRYWFGDLAKDDKYDEWVPAQRWQVELPDLFMYLHGEDYQRTYQKTMNALPSSTLVFVNAWSGWATPDVS